MSRDTYHILFELFGSDSEEKGKYVAIYNRFFRAAFLGAINSYFPKSEYGTVTISNVFHDKQGYLESDSFFPWHLCYKVADGRIKFEADELCFIDSNHKIETTHSSESHFIQIADLLVGAVSHCLDLPTQSNKGKNEIAKCILPLLKDISGQVFSTRSKYDYFRKYDVSFYPSKRLTLQEFFNDADRAQSHFFKNRRILLEEKLFNQPPLKLIF